MGYKISFTSLGCDKNLIDSEVMLGLINKEGYEIISDETKADIIIVNTCCFINDAKEESIETLLELGQYKETGNCKVLIATGCLAERYKDDIFDEMPELDAIVGTKSYEAIIDVIKETLKGNRVKRFDKVTNKDKKISRFISTPGYFEYLKIAEGCDNRCTYCIIPSIRGEYISRPMDEILDEARFLVSKGVKELILVAQDVTRYGIDIYSKKELPALLTQLCKIEDLKWIRLMYCYPEEITEELMDVIAKEDKVLKYIDMPIQHSNDEILKKMARKSSEEKIRNVINKLRQKIPEICLRTTIITGFPGENESHYNDLKDFVSDIKFDRLGVFTYSREENTPAASFENQVSEEIKLQRKDELMLLQQQISKDNSSRMVGEVLDVLVEGKITEEDVFCGRTYKDSPNIDGLVFINTDKELISGEIVKVEIINSSEYDLIGVLKNEYC